MNTAMATHHKFIAHLERLVREKNRGALATLRRGLGKPPGTAREMDRYVLPYLPQDRDLRSTKVDKQENAYYLVGALFAYWHQGKEDLVKGAPANLGDSLRWLVDHEASENGNREDIEKRVEKRLVALLNCHRDDLSDHLRHTIGLLKSKEIPVDWTQLLYDVQNWQHESREVQRNWARKFWRGNARETGPEENQSQNEEDKEEE
ncbi:MAG: type I-E CRISPR-associated protein Cse2/CasB [Chloroflexi bacterium RBG_13_53_26]|nr:MAG: type I-E CRISPR-associated protein Cse2/CasB [Chloroflexi bacterium RBG_13_53_26]